ncbi:MAG TPA: hypothetical protein VGW38_07015 [Chloroflexota bacterium]|nr:hypothetical protein [Chloroflexota bacterium]
MPREIFPFPPTDEDRARIAGKALRPNLNDPKMRALFDRMAQGRPEPVPTTTHTAPEQKGA